MSANVSVMRYAPEHKLSPAWPEIEALVARGSGVDKLGIATRVRANQMLVGVVVAFSPLSGRRGAHNAGLAALRDWPESLRRRFGAAGVQLGRGSAHSLVVWSPAALLPAVGAWLAAQPAVHWVEPLPRLRQHNREASAIVQAGTAASDSGGLDYTSPTYHPAWAAGLTGSGQVIGAGDSGVDRFHCFFYDPDVDWDDNVSYQDGVQTFSSTQHRKIRYYRAYGDMADYNGHGTHTMGTLLGSMIGGLNYTASGSSSSNAYGSDDSATTAQYVGMAPDAKLAFIDLANGASSSIYTPADIEGQYFAYTTAVGAALHSDSWGGSTVQYDYLAAQVDDYHWQHPEFLAFFAAGNDGQLYGSGNSETTVTSPATAKNIVAVGATQTAGESLGAYASRYTTYDATVTMAGQEYGSFKVMQSAFGGALSALGSDSYKLVAADPALACSAPLNDGGNASGAVVLVERGSCYLSDKVATAQAAGAAAALIADNVLGGYFVAGADDGASVSIPSATLTRRLGQTLRTALASGLDLRVAFAPAQAPPTSQSFNNLASYSSQGPTPDGRVKPDLVAPGSLYSAKAAASVGSQTCALTGMQGTSMATPATAGSAALVRQYFVEGRYAGNATADGGGAFTPSGALLKATLISGAASLTGFEALTGMPIDPPPSFRQGFGRVQLETTLPNDGRRPSDASSSSSSASFALQVVDRVPIAQGATHRYCLRSTGGPLTVTLVWTDYPALPSAAKALVNDLDLTVRAAGYAGIPLLGNGGSIANESVPDRENNVEQVSLAYVPAGAVSIEVAGHYVYPGSGDAQPYALTVNGAFSGALGFPSGNDGSGAQECTIVVPEITEGPQGPTNQTPVRFAFGTRGGSSGGLAWECRLTDGDGAMGARGTQNWTACDSPAEFPDLRDGGYVFSVRATGESTLANRTFFLDTSPPELTFSSDSSPAAGASTDAAIANVSFSAADALSVRFQCALSVADGADAQGETVFLGGINVLEWGLGGALQNCTSPMAFHWLLPGRWTLAVQATDAAGNQAGVSNYTWTVAFDAAQPYARLTNGLLGRSRLVSDVVFDFATLQQASDGGVAAVADQGAECALVENYASAASLGDASWAACSRPRSLGNLSEGSYAFFVRPVSVNAVGSTALQGALTDGTGRVAGSAFVLDGTPPVASFSSRPASILAVTNVNIAFDANEARASFNCSVSGPGFEDQSRACTSPLQLKDLTDGNYTVTVVPSDLVGNIGRPITTSFTVDATPPVFESVSYPPATSGSSLTVDFAVSDGNGTGIAYTICRLVSGDTIADSTGTADASGWRNCSSPVTWTSLTENHWILEIEAFDRAGNANSTGDLDFWVDRTPPVIRVSQGPSSFATVQGSLAFSFAEVFSQGGNQSAAPMDAYQLRLASISQDRFDQLKNGTASTDASGNKLASAGRRLLQAADGAAQGSGTVSASDALGGWANCSASCAVSGLDSGTYTYQVRGIDLANNVGNETAPVAFAFEATDSGGGGGGGGGLPTWAIGVIAGVGGAALLALFTWCACALCRNRRRKPPPPPPAAPAVGWPAHAGGAPPGAQHYQPNPVYTPRPANVGYPPALYQPAAAVEEQQLAYALAASEYEARVQAQKREAAARAARQGAVNGGAPNGSLTGGAPNGARQAQPPMNGQSDEDAQLRAAIEASLREQNLTRQWDPWRG